MAQPPRSADVSRGSDPRAPARPPITQSHMTSLGLQNAEERYSQICDIQGHRYTVPPINRFDAKQSRQRFEKIAGNINPRFTPESFDRLRERMQTATGTTRNESLEAVGVIYSQKLAENFVANSTIDHAEFERMEYPKYAPTYSAALRALGLKRHVPFWRKGHYSDLENICRLPLDRVTVDKEAKLSFEEWYSLFWNYYMPFNAAAFIGLVTAQSFVYTREFIDGLADYVAERLTLIKAQYSDSDAKAPVLLLGCRIGKLAWHLNQTKRIPVAVISCHENPNTNPYLLAIPPELQAEFKPLPIEKTKMESALEKYKPSLVLMTDLEPNKDQTQRVRSYGCVAEYVTLGIADSFIEGHGWDTWGNVRYKPQDDKTRVPPFMADRWKKEPLPLVSRYMISKQDSDMAKGYGSATSFHREKLASTLASRMRVFARRIATRY